MRGTTLPWYILWSTVALWVCMLPYSRVVQAATALWVLFSFFLTPPKPWLAFQRAVRWLQIGKAFPIRYDTSEYTATSAGKLMFTVFPHGVYSAGVNFGYGTDGLWQQAGLPDVEGRYLIGSGFWFLPIAREWYSWLGFGKCDKPTLTKAMKAQLPVALLPGGFEEAVLSQPGKEQLWLGARAGFIKLALQHGYSLVPVYNFGETDLGKQARCCLRARARFAGKTRIPAVCPLRPVIDTHSITCVVGKPMALPTIAKPSKTDVEAWRVKFIACLTELYNRHRAAHGRAGVPLEILP